MIQVPFDAQMDHGWPPPLRLTDRANHGGASATTCGGGQPLHPIYGHASRLMEYIGKLPWVLVVIACLTLGLAPFSPPHLWEKLHLLSKANS